MAKDVADRVRAETLRFHDALPELMKTLAGRWVVFRDGEVKSDHTTEAEAYDSGVAVLGLEGGFVVAPVAEVVALPVTASVAIFG